MKGTWEEERKGRGKRGGRIRYGRRCTEGQEIEQRFVVIGDGEQESENPRCQESKSLPGSSMDDIS